MTQNVLQLWPEILGVIASIIVLVLFAVTLGMRHRPKVLPGSSGHREQEDETGHEAIHADGYIDSFAKEIEEAGGGMPPVVKLLLPGILLWWLIYLILNWAPR
jgi:hypothetical protein